MPKKCTALPNPVLSTNCVESSSHSAYNNSHADRLILDSVVHVIKRMSFHRNVPFGGAFNGAIFLAFTLPPSVVCPLLISAVANCWNISSSLPGGNTFFLIISNAILLDWTRLSNTSKMGTSCCIFT